MDPSKGVKLKLCSHQKQHYKEIELLVNLRDLGPNVKEGDVLEIYHAEEDEQQPRLLLQIPHYNEEVVVTKDTISVEKNIASAFQLRSYKDVIVNKVDPRSVALELLELTFKDQYLGRSDMWRLKRSLINTVTYTNKIIEFCSNSIRCQTYEMWAQGEKVACGVISKDTKVVFRSSTCQAYLFIQMSSEMWEFDNYGDLYFEKAVNGFLAELFAKWEKSSNHDVTIVLFSRTYYKASSWDEFPTSMRECLVQDYQGRFYEDFYRVAVQSERYEDWMPTLGHLRHLFHNYLDDVLNYHSNSDSEIPIPESYNSNAAQGNFLEVLNISLNVFEKHYSDRSFERTGQMSVVITPGVGVFEVDRELTNITKQRIIDNGVGSDLVCLAEQPLHAVPLLKFHKKRGSFKADDYSMPHTWINLSFYSSKKRAPGSASFIPRIKVPQEILKIVDQNKGKSTFGHSLPHINLNPPPPSDENSLPNSVFDYDAYDAQVFKTANQHSRAYRSLQRPHARKKTTSHSSSQQTPRVNLQRKLSDSDLHKTIEMMTSSSGKAEYVSCLLGRSPAINIPSSITESKPCSHSFGALNIEGVVDKKMSFHSEFEDMSPSVITKMGSSGTNSPNEYHHVSSKLSALRPSRSLINPFNPYVTVKLTSNRRRWIHTFPKGPTGLLIQQHHYQVSSVHLSDEEDEFVNPLYGEDLEGFKAQLRKNEKEEVFRVPDDVLNWRKSSKDKKAGVAAKNEVSQISGASFSSSVSTSSPKRQSQYSHEVQPPPMPGIMHTHPHSVATQQINRHATLLWGATGEQEWNAEITTGVDWKSLTLPACLPLTTDYFPDKQSLQYDYEVAANYSRVPDSFDNVFIELVSQRLSQGFQLIMRPEDDVIDYKPSSSLMRSRRSKQDEVTEEYKLSIGRVFHRLQFKDSSIDVTIYRPKHPYPPLERRYKFRFRSPYLSKYQVSWGEFRTERLESYKWNDLDSYICFNGDPRECRLLEEYKFWRFRLMVLPDVYKTETRKLIETPMGVKTPCDIYHSITFEEQLNTIENFIRYLEVVHRVRKPGNCKKTWATRERLGSVRVGDRPIRIRAATKGSDRVRYESGSKEKEESLRLHNDYDDEFKDDSDLKKLNKSMSLALVMEVMKDSANGLPFITASTSTSLPTNTFISHDATMWVLKRFEDISNQVLAVEYLQKFVDEDLIKHASGVQKKAFINGFYLYCFTLELEKKSVDAFTFESEWFEIRIDPLPSKATWLERDMKHSWLDHAISNGDHFDRSKRGADYPHESSKPEPTFDRTDDQFNYDGMYRTGYFEVDGKVRSDRYEWGSLKYQKSYKPVQGFDLILQWMCATGTLVNDLIQTWQRKAANQSLHLFPVPTEAFVLPFSFNSNPLRSSIVIPLKIESLRTAERDPFAEYDWATLTKRMECFQESILEKFGFLRYTTMERGEQRTSFVHVTGNMIVLIGSPAGGSRPRSASLGKAREQEERRASDPLEQVTPKTEPLQPYFLWSFNYMLTKRWKSSSSGDEILGERILRDFREFCSDQDQRLNVFWNSLSGLSHHHSHSAPNFVDVCMQ